ncbi:hypothetical protein LshimejAT787_0202640 [Lyophyllum shimeji]|uniref:Uncharacterized protein n=1 Tax=Lyophyllum shimeji TaxID=47721 RepID=A0A9P3PFR9_LYOSH|nr:hypothetical protein LshimejAT787_0202640 [Lyophyllum shimeji]
MIPTLYIQVNHGNRGRASFGHRLVSVISWSHENQRKQTCSCACTFLAVILRDAPRKPRHDPRVDGVLSGSPLPGLRPVTGV